MVLTVRNTGSSSPLVARRLKHESVMYRDEGFTGTRAGYARLEEFGNVAQRRRR